MTDIDEIMSLKVALDYAEIPCEVTRHLGGVHLVYPSFTNTICSVIQNNYSYGHEDGLLEIQGLLTVEEAEEDDVVGYLTAEEVFQRIKEDFSTRIIPTKKKPSSHLIPTASGAIITSYD